MTEKNTSQQLKDKLSQLIDNFDIELQKKDLRKKVLSLVDIFKELRRVSKSLVDRTDAKSARDRILFYFRKYPYTVIHGDELLVISGIQDYPRRVRELRVEFGWSILSGITAKEMDSESESEVQLDQYGVSSMKPSDYILLSSEQDKTAAHRWNVANEIRKQKGSMHQKLIAYFKENVGVPVSGDELRYVANNKTEWARRVRELRTEQGWQINTKYTGRPDLDVGMYILESLDQSEAHDRHIPDTVRLKVYVRDKYTCQNCNWSLSDWTKENPRRLELHHKIHHADKGENTEANLITLCNVCHDEVHKKEHKRKG